MNKPQERQITHIKDVFPTNPHPNGLTSGPSTPTKRTTTYKKRSAPNPPSAPSQRSQAPVPASASSALFGPRTTVNPLNSKSRDRTATPNGAPIVPMEGHSLKSDALNATVSSVSHSGSSGYQSDLGVIVNPRNIQSVDDDFDEDECTLMFDEEDDAPAEGRFKSVYEEYQGEDFSTYLNEDDDATPALPVRQYLSRSRTDVTATPVQVSKSELPGTKGRLSKRGLKERLRGLFTLTRSSRKHADKQREPVNNIFDFTYTDSKIGSNDVEEPDALSDVDTGSHERNSWWSKNTLSARSMSSNSDVMFTSRSFTQSTPDIYDAASFASVADSGNDRVNPTTADADFESYRKSTLYKTNGIVGKKCKRKTTLLQKLSNSLRRLDKADRAAIESYAEEYERSGANVVMNPLTALPPDENTYL